MPSQDVEISEYDGAERFWIAFPGITMNLGCKHSLLIPFLSPECPRPPPSRSLSIVVCPVYLLLFLRLLLYSLLD
jgi:hypothetical protein